VRRVVVLVVVCLTLLVLGAGAIWATTLITCPGRECLGTPGRAVMIGTDGDDVIAGLRGRDDISDTAKQDKDSVAGGRGNDTIDVREGNKGLGNGDFVNCGDGRDAVFFDEGADTVVGCEEMNPS
jgi:Ca2+-binding RTX toxin-like protein